MARSGKEFDVLVGANDVGREPTRNSAGSSDAVGSDATTTSSGVVSANAMQAAAPVSANGAHLKNGLKNGASLVGHMSAGQGLGAASTSRAVLVDMVKDVIDSGRSLDTAMAEIESAVIRAALKQQHGNRSAAARQLQLPRQTLQDRMKKHGLWSS
tara:strand:- start:3 stop:470 length:468 start_codon:yes stop_codon:yes gene_type:complete